jgi:WD40 repeat protein
VTLRLPAAALLAALGTCGGILAQGARDAVGLVPRQPVIRVRPRADRKVSDAQIVFEAPGIPGGDSVQEIFTMNLDGSNRRQITHEGLNNFLPHFSPDGTRLAYTRFLTGRYGDPNARTDVIVYDFGSERETRLTDTETAYQPVWSPDGRRIAFGGAGSLWIMDADGSNQHPVAKPGGGPGDKVWGDLAWSPDDWILFSVAQFTDGCFKVRLDKMRPDGTARTRVTDGGPYCTPPGMEQSGDADPGFSADGKTIYSSRGFPWSAAGMPGRTERRLYAFSSDAWTPGKPERDLSLPSAPDCVEGVPKGSPDGTRILLFRACAGEPRSGVTLTDTAGSYRIWIADGFGPDWNPVAK